MSRLQLRAARGAAALTGVAAMLLIAVPAAADPTGRISEVESNGDGTVTLVFSASDLAVGDTLDPASVTVTVDDTAVESTAVLLDGETTVERSTILAIDTSGSMNKKGRLEGAKQAADAFIAAAPADLQIGLVTFDDTATVDVAPTTDRTTVTSAVAALTAQGETALYDAVIVSVDALGTEGARSILIASDGVDTASQATLDDAVTAAGDSGATLDAVSLGRGGQAAALRTMAKATGGKVVTAGQADQLATAFAASARALDNQLAVTVTVPADLQSSGSSVTVSAEAGSTTVTDSAFVPLAGAPQANASATADASGPLVVESSGWYSAVNETYLWLGLAAIFIGIAILLVIAFLRASNRRNSSVRGRMSIYTLGGRQPRKESETTTTALGDTQVAKSAVEFAGRAVRGRDVEELLDRHLDAAGLPLKAPEWALIHVGIATGAALLMLLLSGGRIVVSLIGLALGVVLPWTYLKVKESRRQAAFYSQLPDTLQLLAGSLGAGYSLPQAVDTVVREGNDPIAAEFNRALIEARLGVPIEDALDNIADRMNSQDFHWVVLAIRVQREVGGNLAEVLTNVAATLRERERLRRQVQVLSAEGRLSAVIIILIPIGFALFLLIARPEYLEPLYTTPLGLLMLGFAGLLMLVGVFWLRRVVKVEV